MLKYLALKRQPIVTLLSIVLAAGALSARAQVVPTATKSPFSLTVGGMGSVFQPDYAGDWVPESPGSNYLIPAAQASNYPLYGVGTYVDVKFTRWVQIEAECRWLRFNQFLGISEDNYLIGPRIPIHRFWKANVYGKALIGDARMTYFPGSLRYNSTDIAFGGGADIKLTKRISIRAFDAEYQYYPKWSNFTLSPYGASVGVSYKIF